MLTISSLLYLWLIPLLNKIAFGYSPNLRNSLAEKLGATDIEYPSIDLSFSDNQEISIFGLPEDVALMVYAGQQNFTSNTSFTGDALIYYNYNDNEHTKFIRLDSLPSGNISKMTSLDPYSNDSFILSGAGYIGDKDLSKQVLFNLSSLTYTEIFNQSLPQVNAVLLDDDVVYFGGNFTYADGHSAAMWNLTSNTKSTLPFKGFGEDSFIKSITKINDNSILFTGYFNTLDDSSYLNKTVYYQNNTQIKNSTTENITDISIATNSTQQIQQLVPIQFANWSDDSTSIFQSPESFMCPEVNPSSTPNWVGNDQSSSFSVSFLNTITPSKIRIYMSSSDSVSNFRLLLPNGGIVQLTYLDPFLEDLVSCDVNCNLYSNITSTGTRFLENNITSLSFSPQYQDFVLTPVLPLNGLTFQSLPSSGVNNENSEVYLQGFQVFQDRYFVYANNTLNKPGCADISSFSTATLSNDNWKQGLIGGSYLATQDVQNNPFVEFVPQINIIGNYSFDIYTPGCLQDDSCSSRGIVNATITYEDENGSTSTSSTIIYQNNNEEKYDNIFVGYLYAAPTVTLTYVGPINAQQSNIIMVADRLSVSAEEIPNPVQLVSTSNHTSAHTYNVTETLSRNVSLDIYGLLEYSPQNFTDTNLNSSMKIGNSSLNSYTTSNFVNKGLKDFSLFSTFSNNTLILSSPDFAGIAYITLDDENNIVADSKLSTNGEVTAVGVIENDIQLLFGDFDINNNELSAIYFNETFTSLQNFKSLVNVTTFETLQMPNGLLLSFDNSYFYNWTSQSAFSNSSSFGLSLWSASSNSNGDTLFSGGFFNQSLVPTFDGPLKFGQSLQNVSSLLLTESSVFDYYRAAYINSSANAYAVKVNKTDSTVLMINKENNVTSQIPVDFDDYAIINSMVSAEEVLFLSTNNSDLFFYNLSAVATIYDDTVNDTSAVFNSMIYFKANNTALLCGSFEIGSCNGTCLFDLSSQTWYDFFNSTISGKISKCQLEDDDLLLLSGEFATNSSKETLRLGALNLTSSKLSVYTNSSDYINDFYVSPDNGIYALSNNYSQLSYFDGSMWTNFSMNNFSNENFQIKNVINLPLSNTTKKRDFTDGTSVLLALGSFETYNYGLQNAMIYSEDQWLPYLAAKNLNDADGVIVAPQIFASADMSEQWSSDLPLKNYTQSVSTTTASSHKELVIHTMDRGYVVLLGLALSLATIGFLGFALVMFLVAWRKLTQNNDRGTSRIDEKTILETLPPEQLMRHVGGKEPFPQKTHED
ncbi:hypothetical protein ACO0QE_002792 [Hanseniaspora vineae]